MTSLHLCCLIINGEKSPNPPPPFLSFPSSAFPLLLPPSFRPSLSPPSNSPPFSPLPHSYAFVSFPKSPRSSHPLPHVSSFRYMLHGFMSKLQHIFGSPNWILLHTYSYRVKQTIVHMILSRSVLWGCNKSIFVKNLPAKNTSE